MSDDNAFDAKRKRSAPVVGVDVGGTFTDLFHVDPATGVFKTA